MATPPPYPGNPYGNNPYGNNPYGNNPYGQPAPRKPSTNIVWGILTTLFCCLPFGIVSIVYAAKVDSLWYAGQYAEAEDASRKARNWAIWAAVSAVVVSVLYILLIVGGVISMAALS